MKEDLNFFDKLGPISGSPVVNVSRVLSAAELEQARRGPKGLFLRVVFLNQVTF